MKRMFFVYLLSCICLCNCAPIDEGRQVPDFPKGEVVGYKPIYMNQLTASTIEVQAVQAMENPGKILLVGTRLYVNEKGKGLHVIDNTDPANPVKESFISIPGNLEVSAKDNYLFVDNLQDLVTLRINSDGTVTETDRKTNIFKDSNLSSPEGVRGVFFECADAKKGTVVGWEKTTINSPECYK